MTDLVSLAEAKRQLEIGVLDTAHDTIVSDKISIASDVLMDYLELSEPPDDWYNSASPPVLTVPARIKGCVLVMVTELYENREASKTDVLSSGLKSLLMRSRTPALA